MRNVLYPLENLTGFVPENYGMACSTKVKVEPAFWARVVCAWVFSYLRLLCLCLREVDKWYLIIAAISIVADLRVMFGKSATD
jgi:hypothetical protein